MLSLKQGQKDELKDDLSINFSKDAMVGNTSGNRSLTKNERLFQKVVLLEQSAFPLSDIRIETGFAHF